MSSPTPIRISVCIPTFKRPEMLRRCLQAVEKQRGTGFSYGIIVVDNDANQSARQLVEQRVEGSSLEIRYLQEPVQNIALARNKAVAASAGELIAFIDDDEFPEPTWLQSLHAAILRFEVDGVLGPVLPFFEGTPPAWLDKSGLCTRESFPTGSRMADSRYMRTGNALLRRELFLGDELPFDPAWGLTGGEDAAFFARMLRRGRSFAWTNEARVYEAVPPERQRRGYYLRRAAIRGVTEARTEPLLSLGTLKSLAAVALYSALLPFLLVLGHHLFMRFLVRGCDHLAKLLAKIGIRLVAARTF